MKITTKGQVTIPVEIREKLGLLPNTEVEFEVVGKAVRCARSGAPTVRDAAESRSSSDCVAADPFG
jgi:AbrB family looped-hinge helix DNA binding protein